MPAAVITLDLWCHACGQAFTHDRPAGRPGRNPQRCPTCRAAGVPGVNDAHAADARARARRAQARRRAAARRARRRLTDQLAGSDRLLDATPELVELARLLDTPAEWGRGQVARCAVRAAHAQGREATRQALLELAAAALRWAGGLRPLQGDRG